MWTRFPKGRRGFSIQNETALHTVLKAIIPETAGRAEGLSYPFHSLNLSVAGARWEADSGDDSGANFRRPSLASAWTSGS
jgi:hypothetical protein